MPAVIKDVIFDNRMVSVVLITYNQERHIRKAIESVLSQETAFDYEIIIGEDCSVDKTRAICKEYQQKYPSKIHLFLHESNIGMHQNFLRTVCRANGKYIALCEGDDFWTNPQKLQMQYDLLEKNPDFSGVHTKVCYVDAHDIITGESDLMPKDSSSVSFDYLVQKNVIHTCSFMFRKSVLDETVDSILNAAPIPDYTLFLAAALKGGIYYFNTITAAYRKNAGVSATWTFSNLIKDRLKIYSLFEKYYDLTKHRAALRYKTISIRSAFFSPAKRVGQLFTMPVSFSFNRVHGIVCRVKTLYACSPDRRWRCCQTDYPITIPTEELASLFTRGKQTAQMKIAFLLQVFPCLSETFILNQITGLIDRGCDVTIFAFGQSNDSKQHPNVLKYQLLNRTTYIHVPRSKAGKRFQTALKTISAFMRHPVKLYRLQKKLLESYPSYDYQKFFTAMTFLRNGFDIIHCHYGPMGRQAVILKDIGLKTKISTVFHGHDLSLYLNEHGPEVYTELFSKGDVFLPVSDFWKQKLINLGCPAEKIIVNHMGIDTALFAPNEKGEKTEGTKILTVARLTEKKGYSYALEAVRRAISVLPPIEYHIAGDGPLWGEIKNLTHCLGLENHVIFHGGVDADEVRQLYKKADIFLLPSVTSLNGDMEGIPVSLMEAMACGLPVIASAHSGIPELVIDGQTGFLTPEKDAASIAAQNHSSCG